MIQAGSRWLAVEPWAVVEQGFHPERSRASESVFSLANEFMGVRGFFDEGYSGDSLIGTYFNGVFDEHALSYPNLFRGFAERTHFMVSAVNWLYTRITVGGETLDLHTAKISGFKRRLDFRTGTVERAFVWHAAKGKLRVRFLRFLGAREARCGFQRVELEPLDFSGTVQVVLALDLSPIHEAEGRSLWNCLRCGKRAKVRALLGETSQSGQKLLSAFTWNANRKASRAKDLLDAAGKLAGIDQSFRVRRGCPLVVDRIAAHQIEKRPGVSANAFWKRGMKTAARLLATDVPRELAYNTSYWQQFWDRFDVSINGDPANEQGTRFCIFQLHSTYHGVDPRLNIGAKGLTGEQYGGLAFWDTETYCLPYYIFTDPAAARNLLLYRYNTLPQAKERAQELGCEGARYPMTTIDGTEACGVWHHGDLEIHVPAAVAYGIWHYVRVTSDKDFLYDHGVEMLLEISRFYASHGDWSPKTGEFGLWGVMGADEFHMMVHNNAYTNTMAKKTFEWTLDAVRNMKRQRGGDCKKLLKRLSVSKQELTNWRKMARKMRLQQDPETGLIEQQDGFFDLPDMDLHKIPKDKLPVVKKWPYISRSRYNWIKQPDVLLLPFFFSGDYTLDEKRVNYEYYEPKCIHESSLSPAVHSILATELGMHKKAFEYVQYSSRLDLDDYNGNTEQGLHMTSMAGAWMSLVYGFGGMRSDGKRISFHPTIPKKWKSYSFRVLYRGAVIEVRVDRKQAVFERLDGPSVSIDIHGQKTRLASDTVRVPLAAELKRS